MSWGDPLFLTITVNIYDTYYFGMHLLNQATKNIMLVLPETLNLQVPVDAAIFKFDF